MNAFGKGFITAFLLTVYFPLCAQLSFIAYPDFAATVKSRQFPRLTSDQFLLSGWTCPGFVPVEPTADYSTGGGFYGSSVKSLNGTIDEVKRAYRPGDGFPLPPAISISFKPVNFNYPQCSKGDPGIREYAAGNLLLYAAVLKEYASLKGYDTSYAFLVNMGVVSGKKRFYVVNLLSMEVEQMGLVSQGRGQGCSKYDRQYSNIVDSKCTSLGRYRISNKYRGSYGESYRLIGLDSTNHNALKRNIVLHAMGCITDNETGAPACISEGCPAVSVNFLASLSAIIDRSTRPVLLWVFDSNLEELVIKNTMEPDLENIPYHICSLHPHHEFPLP